MNDFEAYMTSSTHQKSGSGSASVERGEVYSDCREGMLESVTTLPLRHGGRVDTLKIGWRLTGPPSAPIVVALGGISAHRKVFAARGEDPNSGWWSEVVGVGLALPAEHYRILSFDYLGGSGATSGPKDGRDFPSVSTYDQGELLLRLLNHLQIDQLDAIIGASYGGMVALAFAEQYAYRVKKLVVISAADRTSPMSTAWRSVQRRIVRFGVESGKPERGLELARALAMSTYRSAEEFSSRFAGVAEVRDGRFVFPVEDYLMARGVDYARRYQPDSFLTLSESIDLHQINPDQISVPVVAIAVKQDQLVPAVDIQSMCSRLPNAHVHEISSVFGHDAFLKEHDALKAIFSAELPPTA